jgi:Arc/MetJ family transcription regulator
MSMAAKKRTSVLLDEALLKKARRALNVSTNTEAISKSLEQALLNKDIETALRELIRKGRERFVDVYR